MSYSVGDVRRWDAGGVTTARSSIAERQAIAEDARRILSDGREALAAGWEGVAADAVLDAADAENAHANSLGGHLEDLARELARASQALEPAVQAVRDRVVEAEAAGLALVNSTITPADGRDDITQATVDSHAESISLALDVVASLDEHYGRQIDLITTRLHRAIPSEVDRNPIPPPDDPWPGRAVDAITGAMAVGFPEHADELDPRTRGRHTLNPAPDDFGRPVSTGLRALGKLARPLGMAMTLHDGVEGYARGETGAVETAVETGGALGGGVVGGAAMGAWAGAGAGPIGAIIGGGIGAAAGSPLGKTYGDLAYESWTKHHDLLLQQYYYAI